MLRIRPQRGHSLKSNGPTIESGRDQGGPLVPQLLGWWDVSPVDPSLPPPDLWTLNLQGWCLGMRIFKSPGDCEDQRDLGPLLWCFLPNRGGPLTGRASESHWRSVVDSPRPQPPPLLNGFTGALQRDRVIPLQSRKRVYLLFDRSTFQCRESAT